MKRKRRAPASRGGKRSRIQYTTFRAPRRYTSTAMVVPGFTRRAGYYKSAGDGEKKFFDTILAGTTVGVSGTILSSSLNLIPQGATQNERIGLKCKAVSLHIRGKVSLDPTATATDAMDRVRFIVYVDKQANGAAATAANILEATVNIDAFRNLENTHRFRILADKIYTVASTASDGTTFIRSSRTIKHNIDCSYQLYFDGATGAITEVRSNNLGVLAVSENGDAKASYTARLRFYG